MAEIRAKAKFSSNLDMLWEMRKTRSKLIRELEKERNSRIFVLWNLDELTRDDFYTLADMLEEESPGCDIDMIVLSPGGSGEAGYRIGHTFQRWTRKRNLEFRVIIPRYAMSAATILSLGAQKLVMGLPSEIGPIDPQIPKFNAYRGVWRYIPAMSMMDGLKLVSEYIKKIPEMSRLFEEVIQNEKLTLDDLGMLERLRECGKQYGEGLLTGGMVPDKNTARNTVERLSDYYKFHGYPIDAFEAEEQLKLKVEHIEGETWSKIKSLRDLYNDFVGKSGFIPGIVVSCAIETAALRHWRYVVEEQRDQYVRAIVPDASAPIPYSNSSN